MLKKPAVSFLLLITGIFSAQGPITLGNNNMPGNNDTLRYTNVLISSLPDYTATGINHNWNFSNVTSLNEGVRSFRSALLTPYAFFFLGFNEYGEKIADSLGLGPLSITQYYNFYRKQNNPPAFLADGVGMTLSGVPVPSYYSDKDELYRFPMTYPQYDSTTFRFSTTAASIVPVKYSKTGYRITVVDGWGLISTPGGTANCLRLVTTQYSMDTVKVSLFPLALPNVQRSYQWLTTTAKIPFFEITGSVTGNNFIPTVARYRGRNMSGITSVEEGSLPVFRPAFPNPAVDLLTVDPGFVKYWIFDQQGRILRAAEISGETISLEGLAPDMYVLMLEGPGGMVVERLVKE